MISLPRCQRCGSSPPIFYSRNLEFSDERLCAHCMMLLRPGWRPWDWQELWVSVRRAS
jgi:hypothetical protein